MGREWWVGGRCDEEVCRMWMDFMYLFLFFRNEQKVSGEK